jgi:hypothetical protein
MTVSERVRHQQVAELVLHARVRRRQPRQQQRPQKQRSHAHGEDSQPLPPGYRSESPFQPPQHVSF